MKTVLGLCIFGIGLIFAQQQEQNAAEGHDEMLAAVMQNKSGEIVGTVIDAGNRQPLEGVTVEIPGSGKTVQTNKDGQYSIVGVQSGTYQLKASKSGYLSQTEQNVRVNGGDRLTVFFGMKNDNDELQQPVPVLRPMPVYPDVMRRAGVQGIVFVQLSISEKGEVTSAVVEQSRFSGPSGEELNENRQNYRPMEEAAIRAAQQWTFTPAMKSGKPVKTIVTLPFKFKLDSVKSDGKKGKKDH